jgi:AcrR family transcriptional regulator
VDAARQLGEFSMDELAARAGTTKATIYRHFGSKAGVIAAAGGAPPDEATARERVLEAALRAIPRHGLQAVTMAQIAEAAGISPPTLYHHFTSKDDLLLAVVEHVAAQLDPLALIGEAPALDDPRRTLRAFVSRAMRAQEVYLDFLRTMVVEVGTRPELAAAMHERVLKRMWGALSAYLQMQADRGRFRPGHPFLRLVALFGMVTMFNLIRRNFGDRIELPPPDVAADELLRIFFEGVTNGDRGG